MNADFEITYRWYYAGIATHDATVKQLMEEYTRRLKDMVGKEIDGKIITAVDVTGEGTPYQTITFTGHYKKDQCDHIIGEWKGHDDGGVLKQSDLSCYDDREIRTRFIFCPLCGERIDWERKP